MVPGEDEVGSRPRDTAVVGWLVLVGGLLWMLVVGWGADVYWGFLLAEPSCLAAGTCTGEDLGRHQREAWAALAPGTLLALVGAALVVGRLVGSGRVLVDRNRGTFWVVHRAVFVTIGVGAVAVIPLAGAAVVSPPLGAAGLAVVLVVLGLALHAALRPRRPRSGAGVSGGRPTR